MIDNQLSSGKIGDKQFKLIRNVKNRPYIMCDEDAVCLSANQKSAQSKVANEKIAMMSKNTNTF